MMPNDLFVRLASYAPREGKTFIENFFTELVGHLLAHEDAARQEFLEVALGREEARNFQAPEVKTQVTLESRNAGLEHRRPDLELVSDTESLFVENKVDAPLPEDQLRAYLRYADERGNGRLVVATKRHNPIVDKFKKETPALREIYWWEVADRWDEKRQTFKNQYLIENVLEFMEHYDMGPVRPFQGEDIGSPEPGDAFHEKAEKTLVRLRNRIQEAKWPSATELSLADVYPRYDGRGHKNYKSYKGLVRYGLPATADTPKDAYFWYFLGFRFGPPHEWFMPLADEKQPECIAFVAGWGDRKSPTGLKELMVGEAKELNARAAPPPFQVEGSQNQIGLFLFRRRQLREFLAVQEADRIRAVMNFFEDSHNLLEGSVPRIHEHLRHGT
jgi:hypothetical protein